jgi:phospholipid/cholesterol/gamma-HCH transport system ATP-binding protein
MPIPASTPRFAPTGSRRTSYSVDASCGLSGAEERFPAELSGGMRKRAAIARALALDPSILFLDEPSAGLDPVLSAELDRLVLRLARELEVTVVLVTHELDSVFRIVQRAVMLDHKAGGIVAQGDPRALRHSDDPAVRRFFEAQPRRARCPAGD